MTQVYVPDPASVGQHMHDVATEMNRRGFQVVVFTADRGYEDPSQHYARREQLDGVHIVRLPWSSFGKSSIAARMLGGSSFIAQATALALAMPRLDSVLVSTSPPMCGLAGATISRIRGVPFVFWVMDLNPDQIVAAGRLTANSVPVRAFDWINRETLKRARAVVALDRFMAQRLSARHDLHEKLSVIPPWPHLDTSAPVVETADSPFRTTHGLQDKLVVMYSGNLSPVHPINTVLEAARVLQHEPRFVFVFVGGGLGRRDIERFVEDHQLRNVRVLPYQKLADLPLSLAAADVHLVSMGEGMVGIVHPCKIYGAMAVGRPILALGPRASHIAEIVVGNGIGWHVEHGDIAGAVEALKSIGQLQTADLLELGSRARQVVSAAFSLPHLRGQFCDLIANY